MTFLTVPLPMYCPMDARESTARISPCLNTNPKVVVPWLNLMAGFRADW